MKAYELIDSPEKWVNHCPSNEEMYGGRHCAMTAILAAYGSFRAVGVLNRLQEIVGGVAEWNDASDYETVVGELKSNDM